MHADYTFHEFQAIAAMADDSFKELARTQASLTEAESRQREILEHLDAGVVYHQPGGSCDPLCQSNRRKTHRYGSRDRIVGHECIAIYLPDGKRRLPDHRPWADHG